MAVEMLKQLEPPTYGRQVVTKRFEEPSFKYDGVSRRAGLELVLPPALVAYGYVKFHFVDVPNTGKAVSFYKAVFGAEEVYRARFQPNPCGETTVLIMNHRHTRIILNEVPDWKKPKDDVFWYRRQPIIVEDINEAFERAVSAGATVVDGISKYEFDGIDKDVMLDGEMDKYAEKVLMARVKDPYGIFWSFVSLPKVPPKGRLAKILDVLFSADQ